MADTSIIRLPFRPLSHYGSKGDIIGQGAYSEVYVTGQDYVIKVLKDVPPPETDINGNPADQIVIINHAIIREVAVLVHLGSHPNIVPLVDVIVEKGCLALVLRQAKSNLVNYLNLWQPSDLSFKAIVYQLIRGIAHVHQRNLIHRDIKSVNSLVYPGLDPNDFILRRLIAIADFGLSRPFGCPGTSMTGDMFTSYYRPPEILLGSSTYNQEADVWALGCTILDLKHGEAFFSRPTDKGKTNEDLETLVLDRQFQFLGTPNEFVWPGVTELPRWSNDFVVYPGERADTDPHKSFNTLINRMLTLDPARRPSAAQLLLDPYFKGVREEYEAQYPESTPRQGLSCIDRLKIDQKLVPRVDEGRWIPAVRLAQLWYRDQWILSLETTGLILTILNKILGLESQDRQYDVSYVAMAVMFGTSLGGGHWGHHQNIYSFYQGHGLTDDPETFKERGRQVVKELRFDLLMTTPQSYIEYWLKESADFDDEYDEMVYYLTHEYYLSGGQFDLDSWDVALMLTNIARRVTQQPILHPEHVDGFIIKRARSFVEQLRRAGPNRSFPGMDMILDHETIVATYQSNPLKLKSFNDR